MQKLREIDTLQKTKEPTKFLASSCGKISGNEQIIVEKVLEIDAHLEDLN